jgi:hypothetical protein
MIQMKRNDLLKLFLVLAFFSRNNDFKCTGSNTVSITN